eukprot:s1782_g11.t1
MAATSLADSRCAHPPEPSCAPQSNHRRGCGHHEEADLRGPDLYGRSVKSPSGSISGPQSAQNANSRTSCALDCPAHPPDGKGPLEVAHSVCDLVNGMVEADALKYVPPAKCVTRMQEITATKPPKELKLDASGSGILVKDSQSEQTCAVNTELDIMEAMTRRSLAFDGVGVADFAFVKMQELTREGIKPKAEGTRPLDKILKELPQDHSVVYYMLPTPEAAKEKPQPKAKPEKPAWTLSPWKGNESSSWRGPKQTQWKGKKGASASNGGKLPIQLRGAVPLLITPQRQNQMEFNARQRTQPKSMRLNPLGLCLRLGDDRDGDQAKIPQADASLAQTATTDMPLVTTDEMTAPFAVEFCSGTGGLTAQLRKAGLKSYLKSPLCAYAHFGLPCGTSSRAREIELPGMKSAPAPLRDADHPDGKPDLSARDAKRVAAANAVYAAGCRLIILCIMLGVRWSVEQPSRSWFWATSFWHFVLMHIQPIYVQFQSCMWGGQRPKRTTIATDMVELSSLACECDGQHTHLPWGYTPEGFATAAEVEYPLELCRQWAMLVAKAVEEKFHASATCHTKRRSMSPSATPATQNDAAPATTKRVARPS